MAVLMQDVIERLTEIMESQDLSYKFYSEMTPTFSLTFPLRNTKLRSVNIRVHLMPSSPGAEDCAKIVSLGFVGLRADADCVQEVAELLHRINFGTSFGNFDLDFNDGEIRYKMSLNCVDTMPGKDAIEDLWVVPTIMVSRYANSLLEVVMGISSAKDAYDRVHGPED